MTEQSVSRGARLPLVFLLAVVLHVVFLQSCSKMTRDEVRALEEEDDDIFGGLYLAEDDDRHLDNPNEKESTNNPTILGYTRSVSNERTDACRPSRIFFKIWSEPTCKGVNDLRCSQII